MNKKICGVCKTEKLAEEFHKNPTRKDGLQVMCKECRKKYHKKHYNINKEKYIKNAGDYRINMAKWFAEEKKKLKCENCGENRYWLLDFHHNDPKEKDVEVSRLVNRCNRNKIIEEMAKCAVLCANCHRDFHFKEKNATVV